MSQCVTAVTAAAVPKPQGKQGSLFIYAPDPQGSWVQILCGEIEFHHQRHTRWHAGKTPNDVDSGFSSRAIVNAF